jgi:hypothetical protein
MPRPSLQTYFSNLLSTSGSLILNSNFKEYEGRTKDRTGPAYITVVENSGCLMTTL